MEVVGPRIWFNLDGHATLTARAPVTGGVGQRSVVALYPDGAVGISFSSYAGSDSGFAVRALTTESFPSRANSLFGFKGTGQWAKTGPDWITEARIDDLMKFSTEVAEAYQAEVERIAAIAVSCCQRVSTTAMAEPGAPPG